MTDFSHKRWKLEAVAFYALQTIKGVGFHTLNKLAKGGVRFHDLLFSTDVEYFQKTLGIVYADEDIKEPQDWVIIQNAYWAIGMEIASSIGKQGIGVIFNEQDAFPPQLRAIQNPPMWLFVQGNLNNLYKPSVAIVGSRKTSEDGLWLTKYIVSALADTDVVTVSGLAEGIDQKAHIESMRFDVPTVAILGTGIDSNYPKGSDKVRAEILQKGGTIVSEYLLKQSYSAENFVRRNRIQAGLANAVIPVEWKIKSGTAHTVKFTKDFGRHLLMPYLPKSINNKDELLSVQSFEKGKTFMIPQEGSALMDIIRNFKSDEFHLVDPKSVQQLPFDLD
ncbi:hypothetical protein TUM4438_41510 [Shewanella sairae]|uniref:Smf/DprA SLOG domain-containing protein n=1 Tax=Shewanella sairae TaxID=190310 RepID=A0ABQ4PQM4_9GAMM|nr:DNA-processing protein DprA [Shewanella sairae]MCL1132363.1 DNA-protecting protein DprA [Shewanella sairae]GIU51538.1 hypothetical protein TUM4438_41510 [Shewanella sairae]